MRRALVTGVVVAGLLPLFCGCGGSGGGSEPWTERYLPLAVGNQWRYYFIDHATTATAAVRAARLRHQNLKLVRPAQVTGEDVVTIIGTQRIGGADWYISEAAYAGSDPVTQYNRHIAQGLQAKIGLDGEPFFALRTPLQVGTTWTVPVGDIEDTYRIVSVDDTISTPAGLFRQCLVVEIVWGDDSGVTVTQWYAPQVGMVREEGYVGETLDYEVELLEYELMDPSAG